METFYNNQWRYIPKSKRFLEPEVAMPLVLNERFAYHSQPPVAYEYIKRHFSNVEVCKLTEVHLIHPHYLNIAGQYNSTFGEFFKLAFVFLLN